MAFSDQKVSYKIGDMNILTIDVEDYYNASLGTYEGAGLRITAEESEINRLRRPLRMVLKLLKRFDVRATFFVVGYLAEKYPDLIEEIQAGGHHIGNHSCWHRLVSRLSKREFKQDLERSNRALKKIVNRDITSFRAPAWSYDSVRTKWFWEVLSDNGIVYDSSVFPFKTPLYGDNNAPRFINRREFDITEIPPSTIRFFKWSIPFSGGFYLRFFPYWFIKRSIKYLNALGHPCVVYFHPYEVETSLKRLPGQTIANNFINHFNSSSTMVKLFRLLGDFEFCSIEDYFKVEKA